jgi:hypothetical protein
MTRFVFVVILAVTSTLVGSGVAAEASKPAQANSHASVTSISGSDIDMSELREMPAENSSHLEPRPVARLNELAQIFVPMSWACYTPVGACRMIAPEPVGSSCYCVFPGGTFWGTVQ